MDLLFPDLYRFTGESPRGESLYTFLLIREDGNLLLPCQNGSVADHFDEIEELGGIQTQFVTHNHDVDDEVHKAVHDRFGAKLHYHETERGDISKKNGCPSEEFGDDGVAVGSDFRAIYFPSCCVGSCLYQWTSHGKEFLFTSHVINMVDGQWKMDLDLWQYRNLRDWGEGQMPPDPRSRIASVGEIRLDYTMPNVKAEEEYHQFTDETRSSFRETLEAKLDEESVHVQSD